MKETADEKELIALSQNGDQKAFGKLWQNYQKMVFAWCLRLLKNETDAEDVTWIIAAKVWTKLPGFKGGSAFATWVTAITRNYCFDVQRRRRVVFVDLTEVHGSWSRGQHPDTINMARDDLSIVRSFMKTLSPKHQDALLYRIRGLPYAEAALLCNCPIGTYMSRLCYAREKLLKLCPTITIPD